MESKPHGTKPLNGDEARKYEDMVDQLEQLEE